MWDWISMRDLSLREWKCWTFMSNNVPSSEADEIEGDSLVVRSAVV